MGSGGQKSLAVNQLRGREAGQMSGIEPLEQNPENKIVFGAYKQTKPYKSASQLPSFIRTITVGSGVPPDHVPRLCLRSAQYSWAVPPIGNCTLPRRLLFGCGYYTLPKRKRKVGCYALTQSGNNIPLSGLFKTGY